MARPADSRYLGGYCVLLSRPRATVYRGDESFAVSKVFSELLKDPISIWTGWVCKPPGTYPNTDPFRA